MSRYWFKPRRRGLGVTPVSWEGWASVLVFLALVVAGPQLALRLIDDFRRAQMVILAALLVILAGFIGLCALKTEGGLRWRSDRDE